MSTDEEFVKWAWNNGFGYINSNALVVLFKQATSELKTKLLYAEDAANKGDLARQKAAGMELEIKELREDKDRLNWLENHNWTPESALNLIYSVNIRVAIDNKRNETRNKS